MNVKIVVLSAAAAVLGVACGTDGSSNVDELSSAITPNPSDSGGMWFGSDTLKTAIFLAEGSGTGWAKSNLVYQGKGSGIGEACIRNGTGSTVGTTTYCATLPNSATQPFQVMAPMSRDLKASQGDGGACIGGGAVVSGCCPGERSNVIALDGVDVWVKASNKSKNIALADLKALFCGNADGNSSTAKYPTGCVTKFGDGGIEFNLGDAGYSQEVLEMYVRNDSSGTTDAFQTLVGCKNKNAATEPYVYCPGIIQVTDSASGSVYPTLVSWDSTGHARTAVSTDGGGGFLCTKGSDATTCIGQLVERDTTSIGYAGGSATDGTNNLAISVGNVAPTKANIQSLLTNSTTTYPLARRLFLNEAGSGGGTVYTADSDEAAFYNWIYGNPQKAVVDHKVKFESALTGKGFIACSGAAALSCGFDGGVGKCFGYDGGHALADGRGTGNCQAAPPTTNAECVR
jgi:phosphate transport system substrate-binding protein